MDNSLNVFSGKHSRHPHSNRNGLGPGIRLPRIVVRSHTQPNGPSPPDQPQSGESCHVQCYKHRGALRGTPRSAFSQPEPNATELPDCAPISARTAQRQGGGGGGVAMRARAARARKPRITHSAHSSALCHPLAQISFGTLRRPSRGGYSRIPAACVRRGLVNYAKLNAW